KEYEESKVAAKEKESQKEAAQKEAMDKGEQTSVDAAKPPNPKSGESEAHPEAAADEPAEGEETPADPNAMMGMGMMAGVPGARPEGPPKPKEIKYQPTVWGRYAKLLLSSTEFLFIN